MLFLEASSLTGENVESPFHLAARSILLGIDSGKIDPDKSGSGISFGDRSMALRRIGSNGRLSGFAGFAFGSGSDAGSVRSRGRNGIVKLRDKVGERFESCCS